MSVIAAIILAAGQGARFGVEPKLLAMLNGKPLVRHVAEAALGSSTSPVIVVTGHRAGEVEAALADLPLRIVRNPSYADGLSTSLWAGFAGLPQEANAAIVLLGDMPLIGAPLIDRLTVAWSERGRPAALIPVFEGRRGNPVVLSRAVEAQVRALRGDVGAVAFLRARSDVVEYPVDDAAIVADVDTMEALAGLDRSRSVGKR